MLSGAILLHDHDVLTTVDSAVTSLPPHPFGTLGVTRDGRAYRYGSAGALALAPGMLAVAAAQTATHENCAVNAAAAAGTREVSLTLGAGAVTANQYAGGYLVVNDAAGEGRLYAISGHPAADASASLTVALDQEIAVALTTSSEVSLVLNPWSGAVIAVTDQLDMPVGVPNVTIPANDFGWIQTRGACAVLADETLAIGVSVTTGTSVAGAVEAVDAVSEPLVGIALQAGVDTEYRAIYLQID